MLQAAGSQPEASSADALWWTEAVRGPQQLKPWADQSCNRRLSTMVGQPAWWRRQVSAGMCSFSTHFRQPACLRDVGLTPLRRSRIPERCPERRSRLPDPAGAAGAQVWQLSCCCTACLSTDWCRCCSQFSLVCTCIPPAVGTQLLPLKPQTWWTATHCRVSPQTPPAACAHIFCSL